MADNITSPVAAGTVLATKDTGTRHIPLNALVDQTGADAMGAVGASPDANTLLGRVAAVQAALATIAGHVDGLEGLATTLNTYVDTLETIGGGTNTRLDTIAGYLDTLEALIGATNTALGGTLAVSGPLTAAQLTAAALASEATLAALSAKLPTLGTKAAGGSVSVTPSTDQDPIFDHAAGTLLAATTTSVTLITTGAGHKYIRVSSTADALIRTDGTAAADDGLSIRIIANQPEVIPVPVSTVITARSVSGTASIRATPMKVR